MVEIIIRPQDTRGAPNLAAYPACTRSSISVGTSTSGARASTSDSHNVYRDWVSQVSVKRLKLIAHQFRLKEEVCQPLPDKRPYILPPGMMAFSNSIM